MPVKLNSNYDNLKQSYLFSEIGARVKKFQANNPSADIIKLGIGDVTRPLPKTVVDAIIKAAKEQLDASKFRGYGPETGYDFLKSAIIADYKDKGVNIAAEEIFVSDGAKSDIGNFGDILDADNVVAVTDPVYPVYMDTNIMAGRKIITLPCTEENNFTPSLPKERVDIVYLCYPNNPTGTVLKKDQLQKWVDWANKNKSLILFDGAYEAFITEPEVPHSIYEIPGARTCAVEFRSFSKTAGFTGTRCGYTIIPKEMEKLNKLWNRWMSTKFNGVPYIVQRAAEATFTKQGKKECLENISVYQKNAKIIKDGLKGAGFKVFGGENAPYVWVRTPKNMTSWEFFDLLLNKANVVGTPGSGFGAAGEHYLRLTAFNTTEKTTTAIERIKRLF